MKATSQKSTTNAYRTTDSGLVRGDPEPYEQLPRMDSQPTARGRSARSIRLRQRLIARSSPHPSFTSLTGITTNFPPRGWDLTYPRKYVGLVAHLAHPQRHGSESNLDRRRNLRRAACEKCGFAAGVVFAGRLSRTDPTSALPKSPRPRGRPDGRPRRHRSQTTFFRLECHR